MLTHLHTRRTSLPFPAQTAQRQALTTRRYIAIHKIWMRQHASRAAGKDHLRGLVIDFRECIGALDQVMARHAMVRSLVNFSVAAE